MSLRRLDVDQRAIVMHTDGAVCSTTRELVESAAFERVVGLFVTHLQTHNPAALAEIAVDAADPARGAYLMDLLRLLASNPLERIAGTVPGGEGLLSQREALHNFVEGLYDFWRSFDRFMICHSELGESDGDRRPYRTFNATVEALAQVVRDFYRDACENITGGPPRVYRQVAAGCEVGVIATPRKWAMPTHYRHTLEGIPFVRHVLMYPPLILDPPTNTRTGRFIEVDTNPIADLTLDREQWICYPARVGHLVVFVYFHQRFAGLGFALANLFEVADDEQIAAGPDAIYLYGAPPEALAAYGDQPTVFHDDIANRVLVAAVPLEDRFGYFGYLKKMILTLHNVAAIKQGRLPFHGAFARLVLADGTGANLLLIGDTATGKSESLEALRLLGQEKISELRVIADDMGSLEVGADGAVRGYGTEIGAFVRLDDLQQGYALGQIDRAIIMSPQRVNARVVLPVTTMEEVLHGYAVDLLLYANNYEQVDDDHPIIERFASPEAALVVFREGAAMSKGTTTTTGLVRNYFANVFGAAQREAEHDVIAERTFAAAFAAGVFVGQLRTRLGVAGDETTGSQEAAAALLRLVSERTKGAPGT
jgi:hypothetical protein